MQGPLNVVIVEDAESDFLLIRQEFGRQSMDAHCTRVDTPTALEKHLSQRPWAAVLLDADLPGAVFTESMAFLRTRHPGMPVIVLLPDDQAEDGRHQGAGERVSKAEVFRLPMRLLRYVKDGGGGHPPAATAEPCSEMTCAVLDSLKAIIAVLDREGKIVRVNNGWRESADASGASAATREGVGLNYLEVCAAAKGLTSASDVLDGMRSVLAGRAARFTAEYPCDAPGDVRWFMVQVTPLGGACGGLVVIHVDITERKRAEAELTVSEERLRLARNAAEMGIFDFDLAGHRFEADERVRDLWGLAREAPFTKEAFLLGIRAEGRPAVRDSLEKALDPSGDGQFKAEFYLEVPGPRDEERQVTVSGQAFCLEGRVVRFVGAVLDISSRKRLEREAKERRSDMEFLHQQQIAAHTAAAIAHELNQPLGAISAYNEVALRILHGGIRNPQKLIHALEGGAAQAQRAGRTLHELLEFLRHGETVATALDLNEVVTEALNIAENDGFGGFHPVLMLEAGLKPVLGNRLQVQKVLVNLVRNGVEAMRESGVPAARITITVRTLAGLNMAQVTVQDNGEGLDPAAAARVFEPFFTTKARGIGLGLAICRALVEAHGGQLWLDPADGPGATFHFTLPFAP